MTQAAPRLLGPVFIIAAALLLAAAIGLKPGLAALNSRFAKEPIDLRRPLKDFDVVTLPTFRPARDPDRWRAIGDPGALDMTTRVFDRRTPRPGAEGLGSLLLSVTYFSDPRDRVGHTPEVCYRQDGAVVNDISARTIEVAGIADEPIPVDVRVLDLVNHGRRMVVSYVFCCNGRFYHDREEVRMAIGWPGDRYTYFSKVEAVIYCPRDDLFEDAAAMTCELIGEALPALLADYFPSRADVRGR